MQYLTYEEYIQIGGTIDLTAFNRNINRACGFVDSYTFRRLREISEIPQNVKFCLRDMVEYLAYNLPNEKSLQSKSQSAGGVSESESYVTKTPDEVETEMRNIVYDYLFAERDDAGTPLMYRGCTT